MLRIQMHYMTMEKLFLGHWQKAKFFSVSAHLIMHTFNQLNISWQFLNDVSPVMRKPTVCICENKGADQLHSNCEADQHLFFY